LELSSISPEIHGLDTLKNGEVKLGFNGDLYQESGADVVMSTKGDLVRFDSQRERYGIGSTNQVLSVTAGLPAWKTLSTAGSILTTQGDILFEDASGLQRLGFSTSGFVLTTKGTGADPVWEAIPSGSVDVLSQILIMANSTTIGDYTQPASATCSSSATVPATPDYETDFSVSTGWSANTSNIQIDTGNSEVDFQQDTGSLDQEVYYDLGLIDDAKWLLRWKITFDNINLNSSGGQANEFKFGIYDINNPSGETPSGTDAICSTIASGSGSIGNQIFTLDGGSRSTTYSNNDPFSTSTATATAFYCQLTRESSTSTTYKVFSNSDYSTGQVGSTVTHTTPATVVSLRYLMFRIYSQAVTGAGVNASITDVKFWDGMNTPETTPNPCSLAVDDNVATFWKSSAEANPNIYVDMSSATTTSNIAVYPNSATDETEIKIQSSPNASAWTDERTITWSNLTEGAWNYIRFNLVSARYWRIYGNSGASKTLAIDEIKVLDSVADADVRNLHGHISISNSDTSLNLAGV